MSTGDWFTLRLLNTTNYQPQIDELNNKVSTLEGNVNFLIDTVAQVRLDIIDINLHLQQHQDSINQLNNTVNSLSTSINDIVNQYKPIMGFTYFNVNFTDFFGNTAVGSFTGGWYRPIKLLNSDITNAGVDLFFLLLVIMENSSIVILSRYLFHWLTPMIFVYSRIVQHQVMR
jgi:hypothetical protein